MKTSPGVYEVEGESSGIVTLSWMDSQKDALLGCMDAKMVAMMTMMKYLMDRLEVDHKPTTMDIGVEKLTMKKLE